MRILEDVSRDGLMNFEAWSIFQKDLQNQWDAYALLVCRAIGERSSSLTNNMYA